MTRKVTLILVSILFAMSIMGCVSSEELEFDASGYVKATLDSTYKSSNADYISFTGVSDEIAEENNATLTTNAAIKFFNLYEMNPSESQISDLAEIFKIAYEACVYEVSEIEKTDEGYKIEVDFYPIISFAEISDDVSFMREQAGEEMYETGADYIDDIISLCKDNANSPKEGAMEIQIIDILVDENEIMLNKTKLSEMDELLIPLQ